jgi:hypothetical protein
MIRSIQFMRTPKARLNNSTTSTVRPVIHAAHIRLVDKWINPDAIVRHLSFLIPSLFGIVKFFFFFFFIIIIKVLVLHSPRHWSGVFCPKKLVCLTTLLFLLVVHTGTRHCWRCRRVDVLGACKSHTWQTSNSWINFRSLPHVTPYCSTWRGLLSVGL